MTTGNEKRSQHFVGSETSRVEVVIYPTHPPIQGEPPRGVLKFDSVPARTPSQTSTHVVSVQTSKQLGSPSGNFKVTIKSDQNLLELVHDGDWIDIVFTRHADKYHVLRGLVVTISRATNASSGPTVATYTLVGGDFGLVFEEQGIWFDIFSGADIFPLIASRVWSTKDNFIAARPDVVVAGILRSFLLPGNNTAAGYRKLPDSLPLPEFTSRVRSGIRRQRAKSFVDASVFVDGYSNVPPRISAILMASFTSSASTIWSLAAEFADFMLCELFTDLVAVPRTATVPAVGAPSAAVPVSEVALSGTATPGETDMGVIFRDRPFPNTVRDKDNLLNAPYFSLPIVEVPAQHVATTELSRQGMLRKNAFFFGPSLLHEGIPNYMEFQRPIIDPESIEYHGMRRLDARSRYISSAEIVAPPGTNGVNGKPDSYKVFAYEYRDIVRDLNCLNHIYESGRIELNHSRPDIRIGTRFRILGHSADEDFTCYVESVQHSWSYTNGARTELIVTHGWTGTDNQYVTRLRNEIDRYKLFEPEKAAPEDASSDAARISNYVTRIAADVGDTLLDAIEDNQSMVIIRPNDIDGTSENSE